MHHSSDNPIIHTLYQTMRTLRFIFVICLAACLSCIKVSPSPVPSGQDSHSSRSQHRVALASGAYRGLHDPTTRSTVYYGIPYARGGRFKRPVPIEEDTRTVKQTTDATQHSPACTNFNIPPPYDEGFKELLGSAPIAPQSEDCLTMDVYVPDGAQTCDHQLPVLVFIAGGGFLNGASFIYDLRPMLEKAIDLDKPFIGVVIQYRLGPFGFLNPSTRLDDFNLGLLDQREALRYVRDNIAAFGGDRSRVTLSECEFRRGIRRLTNLPRQWGRVQVRSLHSISSSLQVQRSSSSTPSGSPVCRPPQHPSSKVRPTPWTTSLPQ